MARNVFVGVEDVARRVKKLYVGVDGTARKIKKAFVGVGGVARQVYIAESKPPVYTGTYTTSTVTLDGQQYTLYTLTSSGTLTVTGDDLRAWICGGGANGRRATTHTYSNSLTGTQYDGTSGDGGGGGYTAEGMIPDGTYAVNIGGASGATSIGKRLIANGSSSASGGSGGGGGGYCTNNGHPKDYTLYSGGSGQGISTIPFGIASLGKHCAGGGGGQPTGDYDLTGGDGGSDGSSGEKCRSGGSGKSYGGDKGGGGGEWGRDATSATFYGSGGGGASFNLDRTNNPGTGYQGVAYLLYRQGA